MGGLTHAALLLTAVVIGADAQQYYSAGVTLLPTATAVNNFGANAYGVAGLTLTGNSVNYYLIVTNMSGPVTRAHFHLSNTSIVYTICANPTDCNGATQFSGTWADASAYLSAFASGGMYLNVHTAANGAGEIRADVMLPVAASPSQAASVLSSSTSGGLGIVALKFTGTDLTYSAVVTNMTGPITKAHFHNGSLTTSGPVLSPICNSCPAFTYNFSGTWSGLTSDQVALLSVGNIYINFHTDANPNGEIRAQVMMSAPPPTTTTTPTVNPTTTTLATTPKVNSTTATTPTVNPTPTPSAGTPSPAPSPTGTGGAPSSTTAKSAAPRALPPAASAVSLLVAAVVAARALLGR